MKIGTIVHEENGMRVVVAGGAMVGFSYMIVDANGVDVASFAFKSEAIETVKYGAEIFENVDARDAIDEEIAAEHNAGAEWFEHASAEEIAVAVADMTESIQDEVYGELDAMYAIKLAEQRAAGNAGNEVASEFNFGFDGETEAIRLDAIEEFTDTSGEEWDGHSDGLDTIRPYGYENGRCVECGASDGSHYGNCNAVN